MIRHIVSMTFAVEDAAGKSRVFDEIAAALGALLAVIPEIRSLQFGRDLDATEGNWDAVLVADYANAADLAAYQVHPEHVIVKAMIGARTAQRVTVDFEL
jgi:hypothetical protein